MFPDRHPAPSPHRTLRLLLALAPVGPRLRREARRALAARSPAGVREVGRRLVRHLRQRGLLRRVVAPVGGAATPHLYALHGHTGLLDLSALFTAGEDGAAPPPTPAPRGHAELLSGPEYQERLLATMESLQRLPVTVDRGEDDTAVLAELLSLLRTGFPELSLAVLLLEPADGETETRDGVHRLPPGEPLPWWLQSRREGEACFLAGAADGPAWLREWLAGREDGPVAAVPLYRPEREPEGGETLREIGLLLAAAPGGHPRDALLRLATRLSRFVTASWRQRQAVTMLVHTDSLTGLRNRGFFDLQYPLELERARRREAPLVLLLGDIDHFKTVNDTYGHPAGDQILQAVARELQHAVRRIDLVCRVGGEEFALVLPDTERAAAAEVVSRLLVRVANLRQPSPDAPDPLRVTMSFGAVAYPEGGDSPAELYRRADAMLYLSKQRGRNRCHFWIPDGEPLVIVPGYQAP